MKFFIGEFYEKLLSHFILNLDWTVLTITLRGDLHAFLHTDVLNPHLCF
jgi:hypothetical protein